MWGKSPKYVHLRSETHKLGNLRGLVLHHFGTRGKKGNNLVVGMAKSLLSKNFKCICWVMLGYERKCC
jgi:hypothetical protein